jgi:tetraacyldisaccharide 4'-kinase
MLSPFSLLYRAITKMRISLYEKGLLKSSSLEIPTISIGNITVGGTGKTPLVAFVAQILAEKDEKVCILTRGYGRENPKKRVLISDGKQILVGDAKVAGDEPFELAKKLSGKAIVVADANRVSAAKWVRENFEVTAFVLDDAFQHHKAKRDLDIVTIDATNPFGNGKLLPAGILREPLENLKRAGAIIITRANLSDEVENLRSNIRKYNSVCPIFVSKNKVENLIELNEFHTKTPSLPKNKNQSPKTKMLAFCALGNPNNFFEQLRREDFDLIKTEKFPDHHFYTQNDIKKLEQKASEANAKILLTTAKDAVKLKNLEFKLPCFLAENGMFFEDEKKLRELIYAVFNR